MKPNFLRLSLITAVALLVAPQTSEATIYTFDVDATSGIGTGSFSVDLPDVWPGNIGHSTVIPALSVRGFFTRGDRWALLSITLNEPLDFRPDNAELSGTSKKTAAFRILPSGKGIFPVDAVADLLGVTLRPSGLTQSEISHQRRSPLLERASLLKAGWYRSRQKPRLTSGILSTDRVVDPAARVLQDASARRAPCPQVASCKGDQVERRRNAPQWTERQVTAGRIRTGETARRQRRQNAVLLG